MTRPTKWDVIPFSKLEQARIPMTHRYSISESIYGIFPQSEYRFEALERDGLGLWHILAVETANGGILIFGNPIDEPQNVGASVWTNIDISFGNLSSNCFLFNDLLLLLNRILLSCKLLG